MTLPQIDSNIKDFLEQTYTNFHKIKYLSMDPLGLVHECRNEPYFLPFALGCALFSYGRVEQIIQTGRRLQESMHNFYPLP